MSGVAEALGRLLAHKEKRAIPTRKSFALSRDPEEVFAIAPIKLVAEQIVQAIAFGNPDAEPQVLVRWNPLSRESVDLESFAQALSSYVERARARNAIPRIWIPHDSALTLIELIGHRYRSNERASEQLRNMGWQCRAFAEEAKYNGQQTVAVAGDLLRQHVLTGQPPTKDAHLGALLAWIVPTPGRDPSEEADARALIPASGVLIRKVDDEVEKLRRDAKRGGGSGDRAKVMIEERLRQGALNEWRLLVQARSAFWSLPLDHADSVQELEEPSLERVGYNLANQMSPASKPHSLARELERHEFSSELAESAFVHGDSIVREHARRKGRVLRTEVMEVEQPKKGRSPCRLSLRVDQEVARVRIGTALQLVNGKVTGKVEALSEGAGGATVLILNVENGVRSTPTIGSVIEWTDSIPKDFSFRKSRVYEAMKATASERIYGAGLKPKGAAQPSENFLEISKSFKRKSK